MTPEEALAIDFAGREAVIETLCTLSAKVASLETEMAKLRKDSSTSSKPPSSDITKPPRRPKASKRHIGARSPKGRKANERLWTVIATCALQGRSAFEFILQALRAEFYDKPRPLLLPGPPSLFSFFAAPSRKRILPSTLEEPTFGHHASSANPVNGYAK